MWGGRVGMAHLTCDNIVHVLMYMYMYMQCFTASVASGCGYIQLSYIYGTCWGTWGGGERGTGPLTFLQ
jgi:hypothetical protein